jgi:hypothetical protein
MQPTKTALQSTTIWLNFIPTVITVLTALSNDQLIAQHPQAVAAIATSLFVLNMLNRFRTDSPIKLK